MAEMTTQFGLLEKGSKTCLPLRSLSVEGDVKGHILGLSINLLYDNGNTGPVEVVFKMPLDDSFVLTGMSAIIDGRKIKAQVKEKEEAKIIYDDAIASGLPAALGEEVTKDIFSISLGNLPSGTKAEINLNLVAQLPIDAENKLAFSLPTLLKERYSPPSADNTPQSSPPTTTGVGMLLEGVAGFILRVHFASTISEISSDTHALNIEDDLVSNTKIVTLADLAVLSRDLVIQIGSKEPHTPLAIVEKGEDKGDTFMSNHVIMVNFIPSIPHKELLREFIFLVDRSGSMSGSFIKSASETLVLFLKSLPEGCYFNIFGFGSRYVSLYAKSVPYDQSSLEMAIDHTLKLKADLGGTEILPPLTKIYEQPLIEGLSRQIFLLTDGSVSNTTACIEKVKSNVHIAKCFTFGIGSGASTALVSGMAAAGKGTAEFVKEGERLQPKVIRSLKHALQPALSDVTVTFDLSSGDSAHVIPKVTPTLYDGERIVVYGVVKGDVPALEGTVTLSGTIISEETIPISHTVSFKQEEEKREGSVIHHLAAKALLTEMENEKKPTEEIIKLSVESSVVSKETAFIAVDEETSNPVNEPLTVYQASIENQLTSLNLIMQSNIDAVLTRGEQLDNLEMKSADLRTNAAVFSKSARNVRNKGGGGFLSGIGSAISSVFSWGGGGASSLAPIETSLSAPLKLQREALSTELVESNESDSLKSRLRNLRDDSLIEDNSSNDSSNNSCSNSKKRRSSYEKERDERGDTPSPEEILIPPQLPHPTNTSKNTPFKIDISAIVLLQQANGSWLLTDKLASLLSTTIDTLKTNCPSECPSLEVWATVMVIVTLQCKCGREKDEWELIVKKADGWLKGQAQNIKTLYEEGKKFI